MRFFAGLTRQQSVDRLGILAATDDNDWGQAAVWPLTFLGNSWIFFGFLLTISVCIRHTIISR